MRFPRIRKLKATITSKSGGSVLVGYRIASIPSQQIGRVDFGRTELVALWESACSLEREYEIELPLLPLLMDPRRWHSLPSALLCRAIFRRQNRQNPRVAARARPN